MVKNIYIDGQIKTLLVLHDENQSMGSPNPVYQALSEQADRIDVLEQQNKSLIHQGEVLLKLLEISTETGNLMAQSLNSLSEDDDLEMLEEQMEAQFEDDLDLLDSE